MHPIKRWREDAGAPVDTRHVGVLDGIRALCIFIVAWYHIWQQSWLWPVLTVGGATLNLDPLVRSGYIWVDAMLLISGFLLYLPYAREMDSPLPSLPETRGFFVRRALRILPSYWLSVFSIFFFVALPQGAYTSGAYMARDLVSHLTFTHVFAFDTYVATQLNVVLWTLAVEVQFYLLFPLLARAFLKRPAAMYAAMVGASFLYRGLVSAFCADTTLLVNQLPAFFDVYANGFLAASIFVKLSKDFRHSAYSRMLFSALSVMLLCALWRIVVRQAGAGSHEVIRLLQMRNRFSLSAVLSAFIICSANAGLLWRSLFSNRLMRYFSAISFNFYIWHQYLAVKLREWGIPHSASLEPNVDGEMPWQWQYTLLCFFLALAVSTVITYAFERPIARRGARMYEAHRTQKKQGRIDRTSVGA